MAKSTWTTTKKTTEAAQKVLLKEQPMTVRQCFYRLVSNGILENTRADYVKVSRALTKARQSGKIPFGWIVDRSRPSYAACVYDDLQQGLTVMRDYYRRDYWQDQPNHVEIWCEKDAVIGSIEAVTRELGVAIHVCRGFTSTTRIHEIAERFLFIDKPIYVFYLGDHDPSGIDIERDLCSRVAQHGGGVFNVRRLAIHQKDIRAFDLPPLRVKSGDSRAAQFKKIYGSECVELDALPPDELRRRIKTGVNELIDLEAWNRALTVEKVERECITNIVTRIKRLNA